MRIVGIRCMMVSKFYFVQLLDKKRNYFTNNRLGPMIREVYFHHVHLVVFKFFSAPQTGGNDADSKPSHPRSIISTSAIHSVSVHTRTLLLKSRSKLCNPVNLSIHESTFSLLFLSLKWKKLSISSNPATL